MSSPLRGGCVLDVLKCFSSSCLDKFGQHSPVFHLLHLFRGLSGCFAQNKTGASGKNGNTGVEYVQPVSPGHLLPVTLYMLKTDTREKSTFLVKMFGL